MSDALIVLIILLCGAVSSFIAYFIYFVTQLSKKYIYVYEVKAIKRYHEVTLCQFFNRKDAYKYSYRLRKSGVYSWVYRFHL